MQTAGEKRKQREPIALTVKRKLERVPNRIGRAASARGAGGKYQLGGVKYVSVQPYTLYADVSTKVICS